MIKVHVLSVLIYIYISCSFFKEKVEPVCVADLGVVAVAFWSPSHFGLGRNRFDAERHKKDWSEA